MPRFKLLSFDLDDTLWSLRPVLIRAERVLKDWLVSRYPPIEPNWTPEKLSALRRELLEARPELRHQISELRIALMIAALQSAGVAQSEAASVALEAFEIFLQARHEVELFEQVEECLRELSQNYRLGVITNGNADIFRLELGGLFSFAVRAEQLGVSKPDPGLFLELQRHAGVTSAEMIHIGDHVEHDIIAAQQLGITTVWANVHQVQWSGADLPDAEIKHFRELPSVISELSA